MPTQVQHYRAQYRKQQERISKLKAERDAARGLSSNAVEGVLVVEEQMRRQSELHNIETGRLRGHVMELRNERDAAQAELDAIAIALEWPRQDESTTLLEEVKEAACNGVLLAEAKSELHQLKVDLKAARAEVERLRAWASSVRERAYAQPYSGARRECRFCGAMDHRPHDNDCLMLDESKEGG